jgi:hypothetical protein
MPAHKSNLVVAAEPQTLKDRFLSAIKTHPTFTFFLLIIAVLLIVINFLLIEGVVFKNPVAIEVNGEKIYQKDWDHRYKIMKYYEENIAKNPPESYANLKDENTEFFIKYLLMRQELAKTGTKVTKEEIDQAIKKLGEEIGGISQLMSRYESFQWTNDDINREFENQLLTDKTEENIIKSARIRVIWIQSPYGDRTEDQITDQLKTQYQEKEKYAQSILKKAKNGEDFVALVQKYSEDQASKAKDGDLGFFKTHMAFPADTTETPPGSGSSTTPPAPVVKKSSIISVGIFASTPQILDMAKGEIKMFSGMPGFSIVKAEEVKGGNFKTLKDWYENTKKNSEIKIFQN